jgi:hypothetical protein
MQISRKQKEDIMSVCFISIVVVIFLVIHITGAL